VRFEPVIKEHQGVIVVRDDAIPGGSKRRFVDRLFGSATEVVYASPVYGGAQIAIAHAAREAGIRSTIFCAKRGDPHQRTIEAKKAGAKIIQVSPGYLTNAKAKARDYCNVTGAHLLPFGLESPVAFEEIATAAAHVQSIVGAIDEVWCVGGSGVLCRGLQQGLIGIKRFNVVQVGRELLSKDVGAAKVHRYPLDFAKDAKKPPPFPSCSNYDAKAWEFIPKNSHAKILFWNVMG
jgi:hypothetical protein